MQGSRYPLWSALRKRETSLVTRPLGQRTPVTEQAVLAYPLDENAPSMGMAQNRYSSQCGHTACNCAWSFRLGETDVEADECARSGRLTNQQTWRFYKLRWGVEVEFARLDGNPGTVRARSSHDARLRDGTGRSILGDGAGPDDFAIKDRRGGRGSKYDPAKRVWPRPCVPYDISCIIWK